MSMISRNEHDLKHIWLRNINQPHQASRHSETPAQPGTASSLPTPQPEEGSAQPLWNILLHPHFIPDAVPVVQAANSSAGNKGAALASSSGGWGAPWPQPARSSCWCCHQHPPTHGPGSPLGPALPLARRKTRHCFPSLSPFPPSHRHTEDKNSEIINIQRRSNARAPDFCFF